MDDAKTRQLIQAHADAVVRGDMETVIGDFSEELRPQVPQIAQALPQPVTAAEVLSVDVGEDESIAQIRYSGESGEKTVRARWREIDGKLMIVHGELVS